MPSKPTPDRFLNFKEVAEMIGLHWTTVRDGKCGTGEIPRIKLSNKAVRFSLNAVQRWMENKAREAEEEKHRQELTMIDLAVEKTRRRKLIRDAYTNIIGGGRYK